jgi:hypothetical protein
MVSIGPQGHHDHPPRDLGIGPASAGTGVGNLAPWRPTEDRRGSARVDPADERGKSAVGCAVSLSRAPRLVAAVGLACGLQAIFTSIHFFASSSPWPWPWRTLWAFAGGRSSWPGNGIPSPETTRPKMPARSAETRTRAAEPANSGPFGSSQEISPNVGLRGGPGRTRTFKQIIMDPAKCALAQSELALSQFGEDRPPFQHGRLLRFHPTNVARTCCPSIAQSCRAIGQSSRFVQAPRGSGSVRHTLGNSRFFAGNFGGRDRDRTCDPYHVKVMPSAS